MSNVKWSEFLLIDGAEISDDDYIVGYKADGSVNFRITKAELVSAMDAGFTAFLKDIPGYESDKNYLGLTTDGNDGLEWKSVSLT